MVPDPFPQDAYADIPDEVLAHLETIARSVHDQWAKGRMQEGWTYGRKYDRRRKRHPSLVPYEALPESEKEYDRATALCTLRSLLAAGFTITPPDKK